MKLLPAKLGVYLTLLLLHLFFSHGDVQGQENGVSPEIESSLATLVGDIERGDFQSAFDSYLQIYRLVLSAHSEEEFWEICTLKCPYHIGQLGWLTGSSVTDFHVLENALDQIENEAQRTSWRKHLDDFGLAHLGETAQPARSQENTLSLSFPHTASGDRRPWTVVRVGNDQVPKWAIVDTGRAPLYFNQLLAENAPIEYRVVRGFFSTQEWDGRPVRLQQVILQGLMLGWQSESHIFSGVYDSKSATGMRDIMILGTMPLLRHDAVCFDWEARVLHLGYLGTCGQTDRVMPYRAWLHSHAMTTDG